ncbi:MAG: HAD hydrolase-like protein [Fibrobacterota bacterium]
MKADEKWVLFDFDGTIAESTDALLTFFNTHIYGKYSSQRLEAEDFQRLRGLSLSEKIKYIDVPFYKVPLMVRTCRRKFYTIIEDLQIISGLEDVCVELKSLGFQLGIISTNNKKNIYEFLEQKNIAHIFDFLMCDRGPFLTVKHRTLKKFMRNKKLSPRDIVYIGDELRDILACRSVGIPIVSVTWGWECRELLDKNNAGNVVDTTEELPAFVQSAYNTV